MGMDLSRAGGYFRWTGSGWADVLEMALENGWEPTGTGPPRGMRKKDWEGSYFFNEGQLFYARDARKLADALEKALKNLPAKEKKTMREFIAFCRAGSFRID